MGGEGSGKKAKVWTSYMVDALADELDEWCKRRGSLWLKDFAREFGIKSRDFAEIMRRTEKGEDAYERAKDWQESVLVRGGLLKKLDSSFTRFVLQNTSSWSEKTTVKGELGFILQNQDGSTKDLTEK